MFNIVVLSNVFFILVSVIIKHMADINKDSNAKYENKVEFSNKQLADHYIYRSGCRDDKKKRSNSNLRIGGANKV